MRARRRTAAAITAVTTLGRVPGVLALGVAALSLSVRRRSVGGGGRHGH